MIFLTFVSCIQIESNTVIVPQKGEPKIELIKIVDGQTIKIRAVFFKKIHDLSFHTFSLKKILTKRFL